MTSKDLYDLLITLPTMTWENETEFKILTVPQLSSILGYPDENLSFEVVSTPERKRPDNIAKSGVSIMDAVIFHPTKKPWIQIETKIIKKGANLFEEAFDAQVRSQVKTREPQFIIMLSPSEVWIYEGKQKSEYIIKDLTQTQASVIFEKLKCRTNQSTSLYKNTPIINSMVVKEGHAVYPVKSEWSQQLDHFTKEVRESATNKEKGLSLENLTEFLFSSVMGITVKYRNLLGSSSEIDLVLEYSKNDYNPVFDGLGRYSLVECKNWSIPVGAQEIRNFSSKLQKTNTQLGFFVSKNGVTGANRGADSLREIQSIYDRGKQYIVVITLEEIANISSADDFLELLDKKTDRIRFDF